MHQVRFFGMMATLLPAIIGAAEIEMHIQALIDGRDQLIVQGGALQWQGLSPPAPGPP